MLLWRVALLVGCGYLECYALSITAWHHAPWHVSLNPVKQSTC